MKKVQAKRTSRSKITYVVNYDETPLSPEERERILALVGRIIGDVHIKEMRSKHDPMHVDREGLASSDENP